MNAIITIKAPCAEKWEDMPLVNDAHFCASCNHEVIDFSEWALQDIILYLQQSQNVKICGRFRNSQLNKPVELIELLPEVMQWHGNYFTKVAALIVICFAATFISCTNNKSSLNSEQQSLQPLIAHQSLSSIQAKLTPYLLQDSLPALENLTMVEAPVPIAGAVVETYYSHTLGLPAVEKIIVEAPADTIPANNTFIGPLENYNDSFLSDNNDSILSK